jgi:hypothetical protein
MNEAPLTPASAMDFPERRSERVLTQQEKNEIRRKNIAEQADFKATAKAKITELSRSGDSERNKALMLANDKLRIDLAHLSDVLRRNRNTIRNLKLARPAQG